MNNGIGHEDDQNSTQELLSEIKCLFDEAEFEVHLENYNSAEVAVAELMDQAKNLRRLLHIIPLRSENPRYFGDANESEFEEMFCLDLTCRETTDEILDIVTAVDAYLADNHGLFGSITVAYDFNIVFLTADKVVLIEKDILIGNDQSKAFIKFANSDDPLVYQMIKGTFPRLWLDDLLNINSLDLKIAITLKKNFAVHRPKGSNSAHR